MSRLKIRVKNITGKFEDLTVSDLIDIDTDSVSGELELLYAKVNSLIKLNEALLSVMSKSDQRMALKYFVVYRIEISDIIL